MTALCCLRSLLPKSTRDLGLKTSIQTFDGFVRCTLMGNQPWPQFQNGIREKSIERTAKVYIMPYCSGSEDITPLSTNAVA